MPPSMGRGGLPPAGFPGNAGLGVAMAICLALALRLPPSLELFLSFCLVFGLDSSSSAEKVLISSVDCVAAGKEWILSNSSFLPKPNIARVFLLGLTGGMGGAFTSDPF
jgi:hypothetical protein